MGGTAMIARIRYAWLSAVGVLLLGLCAASADDKKDEKERKGTVTGVVTARGDAWIEVKADGEEKARQYVPHWRGKNPSEGGGFDKPMLAKLKEVPVNSRVRLEWVADERVRVDKIEVLKKPDE